MLSYGFFLWLWDQSEESLEIVEKIFADFISDNNAPIAFDRRFHYFFLKQAFKTKTLHQSFWKN